MKKILLILSLIVCIGCSVVSLGITTQVPAETRDLVLYRLSLFLFFAVWSFGFATELNIFKLRERILLTNNKTMYHFIFWILILIISIVGITTPYGMISEDYKTRANSFYEENNNITPKNKKDVSSDKINEKSDISYFDIKNDISTVEPIIESSMPSENTTNQGDVYRRPINKYNPKIYHITNATFQEGKIAITIKTIKFESYTGFDYWGGKASGYRAEFVYTAKNMSDDNHCRYHFNPLGKMYVNGTEFSLDWNYDNNLGQEYISQQTLLSGMETQEYKLLYESQTGIEPNDFLIYEDDDIKLNISFGTTDSENNDNNVSVQFSLNDFPSE